MKVPPLSHFPTCVSNQDLHRSFEAMLAGLRCDPPDAFGEDWEETMSDVERLLVEMDEETEFS